MNDQIVEGIWKESGASPEYLAAMRLALFNIEEAHVDSAHWSALPGLCCQAAGGDPDWAEAVSIAWHLLYDAAHLFDSIQDQDQPEPWWQEMGVGAAINVASGLVVSGFAVLNHLHQRRELIPAASEICTRFYNVGFKMSSDQHRDLLTERPGIAEWFEIAEGKSGTFFGLACWAGARLATSDPRRLDGFSRFGSHLGVLLQIYDDLSDLGELKVGNRDESLNGITRSLPVAYALEVCPEEARNRLLESLRTARQQKDSTQDVFDLLDQSGAALYLKIEIERRQALARAALEEAGPDPYIQDALFAFISKFEKNAKPE